MGRHAYYHEYNRHDWEMQELFIQKEENKPGVSFGQNAGFQHGYELVADNYDRKSFTQWFAALEDFIPEDPTIERTIENAGMGCMIIHQIASPADRDRRGRPDRPRLLRRQRPDHRGLSRRDHHQGHV